ncbi:AAA-associated domain-containing protein, partial [Klebsiella pneumoniae]|uniref:AAA-associated domain-containing protein n=1 Tax=Klebsiella pneumoniae TaxID=573 RepID=UPI00371FE973
VLNHVSSNLISGLIETLAGPPYNGHADLPVLAESLQLEADELFHLAEALQLLRFAQLSEGDLTLTDAGKRFANL